MITKRGAEGSADARNEAARELAPTGVLRAGINMSNPLLVTGRTSDGDPDGISPALARRLSEFIGAELRLVPYPNPGAVADQASNDAWDVALIGAEPQRAETIDFSPPYAEIKATYLVPAGSTLKHVSQVDVAGIRIASMARAAYDLWLERNIRHATVLRESSVDASFDRFAAEGLDAMAGLEPRLVHDAARLPGSRLLDGHFMTVQQAIGTPRGRGKAAAAVIREFVESAKQSGLVASLIEQYGVKGLSVSED
jgi:polar amino acid transport system substrate-binding protein